MLAEITTIDVDAVPDDWESLTEMGREIAGAQDKNRWALGDLTVKVHKVYGGESIKKFATEIRMPAHKTLYDYWRTAAFWPVDARTEYPLLSWSHYRAASRAVDLDAARHYLEMADTEDMPVAAMVACMKADLGNPVTQRRTFEALLNHGLGTQMTFNVTDADTLWMLNDTQPSLKLTIVAEWLDARQPGA